MANSGSMRPVELVIPYPDSAKGCREWNRRYSLNAIYAGQHWSRRKQDSDYWHLLVQRELRAKTTPHRMFDRPVEITFLWNDRLDIDNHAYMGKLIVDALKGRLIQDDSRKYLQAVHHAFHQRPCIRVLIQAMQTGD